AAVSAVTDSRIKPGVAQVDEQVRHHDHRTKEQHGALDQGVVTQQHGVEHQASDARLQEDELHDHGAPSSTENCWPMTVTTGMKPFFTAYRTITAHSRARLARAVRM